jgi:hypothetical protein
MPSGIPYPSIFPRWIIWLLISLTKHDFWISLKPDEADDVGR